MPTEPLVFFGAAWLLVSGYTYFKADLEFDSSMELRGVDPDAVRDDSRARGVRRNRLASIAMALVGVGIVVLGFVF